MESSFAVPLKRNVKRAVIFVGRDFEVVVFVSLDFKACVAAGDGNFKSGSSRSEQNFRAFGEGEFLRRGVESNCAVEDVQGAAENCLVVLLDYDIKRAVVVVGREGKTFFRQRNIGSCLVGSGYSNYEIIPREVEAGIFSQGNGFIETESN